MRSLLLILVLSSLYVGCDSANDPSHPTSGLTVTSPSVLLEGGGRWFSGTDTATYYDALVSFTVKNTTSEKQLISYTITFGLLNGDKVATDTSVLISRINSSAGGFTLAASEETTFFDTLLIDLGRKVNDWSQPYGFRLVLTSVHDSAVVVARANGSTPFNRFMGVITTSEFGPDSLGMLDGPEDGDYAAAPDSHLVSLPIYPNPDAPNGNPTFRFRLNERSRLTFRINKTPRVAMHIELIDELMDPGFYEATLTLGTLEFEAGQYRAYIESTRPNRPKTVTFGDFIINE